MALSLRTWLIGSHVAVLAIAMVFAIGSGALSSDLTQQTRWDLEHQGALLSLWVQGLLQDEVDPSKALRRLEPELSYTLKQAKQSTLAGIRLTDNQGVVVASSGVLKATDLSHSPEVQAALAGTTNHSVRPRPAPSKRQPLSAPSRHATVRVFVAVPVVVSGEVVGVLVLSRTPREWVQALYQMLPMGLWWGLVGALVGTIFVAVWASLTFTRTLRRLDYTAMAVANGDLKRLEELKQMTGSRVSEVGSLTRSVASMTEQIEERINYISEFASNVSHEFKTPLATLSATLELLEDDEMPPQQRALFLKNADQEVHRLTELVSGLLALARAEKGELQTVDLTTLIEDVARRHSVTDLDLDRIDVQGVPSQLEALTENLIRNALQHGERPVQIIARRLPTMVVFSVVDVGKGISKANQERLFERFFTTDRRQGTGLGLALVAAIIKRHHGSLEVESEPGKTVFRVTLPRRKT